MEAQNAAKRRVVLVTGASSGIGAATALAFAQRGDRVAATARRADRLDQLVADAKNKGIPGEMQPYAADVLNPDELGRVVADIMARWGRLDVLIANAGLGQRGAIVESAWDDLDIVLRTNIDGVLHSVRAAVPAMRKSGGGQIIMMSSVVALAPGPYSTVYAASKSALNTIARGLRMELMPDHIWVTTILVGQTHSEFATTRRGRPGRVAGKWPTMTAEFVAGRVVRESMRKRRSVTLRFFDRLVNWGGLYAPWIMDRIMARIYRTS